MKRFMDSEFLLKTPTARKLFHSAAENAPIFDYHCHLDPRQIAENKRFEHLTEAWLGGDHYKWRQMRALGIEEKFITGDADPYEKFLAWARAVERLIGNPLYHWTHLELRRFFGIDKPLCEKSAPDIWKAANKRLADEALSVRGIFASARVHAVGTTDDPVDSLEYHRQIAAGTAPIGPIATKVLPSFRPDKALELTAPGYAEYLDALSAVSGVAINSAESLIAALINRLDFFAASGCRAADHGMGRIPFARASHDDVEKAFARARKGESITENEANGFKTALLVALAAAYEKRGIVMQLHFSAIRDNNPRAFARLGANTGFDAAHDVEIAAPLSSLLGAMEENGGLPKTILYSLNPKDYYSMATLMGCFQGGVPGKMQMGSAWWFSDHRDGMETHLRTLANLGMLPLFVGMLTDSRSFLSYPRHEYFRRILCNLLGEWVENGEYPADLAGLGQIVADVSFGNALRYFN